VIGRTIAHYEVTGKLGEGAMGEVYRARDTRLKRDVALKMLSERFAADGERMARLRREAEVLASLSHAHIGQIYGLEPANESLVLVLELVEGETLEERLRKGPLPVERAIDVARQIAAALEAAHERGVIHRDLKPANIKRTPDGEIKVLDFGLAKGIESDLDKTALTRDGAVIGTPAYMAPEQVEGRPIDRRADIWAFGCILYEMLTGLRAFAGDSVGSLFARIATESVDLERISDVPAPVRRLIGKCLRKNPKTRLRDIGDARVELEDVLSGRAEPEPVAPRSGSRWAIGAALALILGASIGLAFPRSRPPEREEAQPLPVMKLSIALDSPPATHFLDSPPGYSPPLAVSPDGRTFVFAALDAEGARQLYVRSADDTNIRPLPGTEGADTPFFSPDGTQLGYTLHGAGNLHRISLADETVRRIVQTFSVRGATWLADDTIICAPAGTGLVRVSLDGKEQTELTSLEEGELDHRWPQILPDQKHLLLTANRKGRGFQPRILSLETGETKPVDIKGSFARYAPGGFLVYMLSNDLWAVRFDPTSGEKLGKPVCVASRIHVSQQGNPHVAISAGGVLAYEPMRPLSPGKSLVRVDRSGNAEPIDTEKGFEFPRYSPDRTKVVFAFHKANSHHDIYLLDLGTGKSMPITSDGNYVSPIWSPDGEALVFSRFGVMNLHTQRLKETRARCLLKKPGLQWALEWRPGGQALVMESLPGRGWDLMELDVVDLGVGNSTLKPLLATDSNEAAGTISPDGGWLAYVSDETGRPEVYVRRYPGLGLKERISSDGGVEPAWSPTGRELFFRFRRGLYAVDVPRDGGRGFGEPRLLFEGPYVEGFQQVANYDVSADGRHFLMVDGGYGLTTGRLDVHLNFRRELEEALPSKD